MNQGRRAQSDSANIGGHAIEKSRRDHYRYPLRLCILASLRWKKRGWEREKGMSTNSSFVTACVMIGGFSRERADPKNCRRNADELVFLGVDLERNRKLITRRRVHGVTGLLGALGMFALFREHAERAERLHR